MALTAPPNLIPGLSCVWYCSIDYIAAILFWKVFRHPGTCLLLGNLPVVQECNSSSGVDLIISLSLGGWLLCLGADLFTVGEREPDNLACSLKVRIKWCWTTVGFLFGSTGLGQDPHGLLNISGLCLCPSPQRFARFSFPSSSFASPCCPGIQKPGFGLS